MEKVNEALASGETTFIPQLELLKILIMGRTEDVTRYQYELGEFIKKYPKEPLKNYAEQLVASSKTLLEKIEKAKGIQFSKVLDGPHFFVVVYNSADRLTNPVVDALEKFNKAEYNKLKLTTTNLGLEEKTLTMCVEFPDRESVMGYYYKFLAQVATTKPFSDYKFYNFVITKDNFQIFWQTKSLDEYLTFFDKVNKRMRDEKVTEALPRLDLSKRVDFEGEKKNPPKKIAQLEKELKKLQKPQAFKSVALRYDDDILQRSPPFSDSPVDGSGH